MQYLRKSPFRLVRYGNPDEPIRLKYFKYTRDKVRILLRFQRLMEEVLQIGLV